jgi:dienelactone hydrolase
MNGTLERRGVLIDIDHVALEGDLEVPEDPVAVVVFVHGSGSNRQSPSNREVAAALHGARLGTLLFDLLTENEAEADAFHRRYRFDIPLLAERLAATTDWVKNERRVRGLRVGYFGASTGAAAALVAAAERPGDVSAIVARGGRPDLAGSALPRVEAPTLLIVGGHDTPVINLNRQALAQIRAPRRLEVVAGATHLFEEAGTLDVVARLATRWFSDHLASA